VQKSKTPAKGAAMFIAGCLARDSYLLTSHNALDTTAELRGGHRRTPPQFNCEFGVSPPAGGAAGPRRTLPGSSAPAGHPATVHLMNHRRHSYMF